MTAKGWVFAVLFAVCLSGQGLAAQPATPFPESDERAIQVAMPYFNAAGFKFENYEVAVSEDSEGVNVHFFNLGAKGWRGCPEQWPHYYVQLLKDRVTVIRAGILNCR